MEAELSVAGAGGIVGGSGSGRSGCSPRSLQLCFVPDPWCVPRRDRNSLLPALHNSLPTPLLPGHCIWSPGWLPPSASAAPWIRELLFFQRKSCFPSQRWGWKAGEGALPLYRASSAREGGKRTPLSWVWWLTGGLVEKVTFGGWQVLHFSSQRIALLVGMQGMGCHPSLHPLFWSTCSHWEPQGIHQALGELGGLELEQGSISRYRLGGLGAGGSGEGAGSRHHLPQSWNKEQMGKANVVSCPLPRSVVSWTWDGDTAPGPVSY